MKGEVAVNDVKIQFYEKVSDLLEQARRNVKSAVNLSMVYTYYEIGKIIIEEEQNGNNRAEYGKYILKELSKHLTEKFGKGFSVTNLKMIRKFYLTYVNDQISQTVFDQFKNLPKTDTGRQFYLSWSHICN